MIEHMIGGAKIDERNPLPVKPGSLPPGAATDAALELLRQLLAETTIGKGGQIVESNTTVTLRFTARSLKILASGPLHFVATNGDDINITDSLPVGDTIFVACQTIIGSNGSAKVLAIR